MVARTNLVFRGAFSTLKALHKWTSYILGCLPLEPRIEKITE